MHFQPLQLALVMVCCQMTSSLAAADSQSLLEQQRAAFRDVRAEVERGNWQATEAHKALLENYVLWPDLRAMDLKARMQTVSHDEVEAYLDQFGVLKPARELRYEYALQLVEEKQLAQYLAIYQEFYQGLDIASLDCLALQAEIAAGQTTRTLKRALDLWNVGKNQAEECDAVFDSLREGNLLAKDQYAKRFALAIDAKQFSLAKYLAGSLNPSHVDEAKEWLQAQNNPSLLVNNYLDYADTALSKKLFAYAVERIAFREPLAADKHWRTLSRHFSFSAAQENHSRRHIALWAARLHLPDAPRMLNDVPVAARDVEVGRWLIRSHLLQRRWRAVLTEIQALPVEERNKNEWHYWEAVALERTNKTNAAELKLEALSKERDYYGFLAADLSESSYALTDAPMIRDQSVAQRLSLLPGLIRARELFHVGLEGKGRSEWDAEMRMLTAAEQVQAALMADSWGWHSRAIATVAKAGEYDDLRVRYPLPWRAEFEQQARTNGVSSSWAYGIARSESLFMRDIRSSAGAIGLMQLMPATGRQTARELRIPWSGQATLTNSTDNIRLGTHYLGKMFARFDDNRVLATAAYNAGPSRVEAWLPTSGDLDARIWIENIPFNETRAYVRRVLTDQTIFHWRMTGKLRRISSELPMITRNNNTANNKTTNEITANQVAANQTTKRKKNSD